MPFLSGGGSSVKIVLGGKTEALNIFGAQDRNLKLIRKSFKARLSVRGSVLTISGSVAEVKRVFSVFSELTHLNRQHGSVTEEMIEQALQCARRRPLAAGQALSNKGAVGLANRSLGEEEITFPSSRRVVLPRTPGQKRYLTALRRHDLVFSIGPAGTGKTYLAVAYALDQLFREEVRRLVLARPAVEAGEKLGYLPGDLSEKIQPYLRPLYDALYEMAGFDKVRSLMEKGITAFYHNDTTLTALFWITAKGIATEVTENTEEQLKKISFWITAFYHNDTTLTALFWITA